VEDFLILILQGILEFILEIISYGPWDWPWATGTKWESKSLCEKCCVWLTIGCGLAAISILLFKRTWITHPNLRLLNLVFAPVISAIISQAIARRRRSNDPEIIPREHFWQAFWFAFGLVVVRFAYAVRH
jgi:hypothetical protein